MKMGVAFGLLLCSLLGASSSLAQKSEPRQIDEFGKSNSEEIQARLDYATIQLQNEPTASLQFLMSRGNNQPLGSAYGDFGIMRAFLTFRKVEASRVIPTYCKSKAEQNTEVWIIPVGAALRVCEPEITAIDKTTMFDSVWYPNYDFGTCCIVDNLGIAGARETLKAFAKLLKTMPDAKGYVFIYGGTNVYWTSDAKGRERTIRNIDSRREIRDMTVAVADIFQEKSVPRSQVIIRETGLVDAPATIEMWIAPTGQNKPKPSPNFPKRKATSPKT